MSDVQISGDTAIKKAPPPSEEPPGDVRLKRIDGERIHLDESGRELREEIRRRKPGGEEPIVDVEWKAHDLPAAGEHESPHHQARRASEALAGARLAAFAARALSLQPVNAGSEVHFSFSVTKRMT
jgi:hypothetical protein